MDVKNEAEMILKLALIRIGEKDQRFENSSGKTQESVCVSDEKEPEITYETEMPLEGSKPYEECQSKLEIITEVGKEKAKIKLLSSIIIAASLLSTSALFIWLTL